MELVRRELAGTRSEAQRLIDAGVVRVRGISAPKSSSLVAAEQPISIESLEKTWVSRGALKLLSALDAFPIEVAGRRALDIGASTGGFTEVLLERGAQSVLALDVGRAQLHERLRGDPRVVSMERTNFRLVDPDELGDPYELVVADMSFISLCAVAQQLAAVCTKGADLVLLVKPQFEAGRGKVGKGGVVRDVETRRAAVAAVIQCMARAGLGARAAITSPITGADGNVEYLLWLRKGLPAADGLEVAE